MESYIAILIARSEIDGNQPMYQEQVILVPAKSTCDATDKAKAFANARIPTRYLNEDGKVVTWNFHKIQMVIPALDQFPELAPQIVEMSVRSFDDLDAYEKLFSPSQEELSN